MALARFVLTADVAIAAGTATPVAGGYGTVSWAGPSSAWAQGFPVTLRKGSLIMADSSAGSTGPQLLYQAIGAGNLRAYVPGQDDVGRPGISN